MRLRFVRHATFAFDAGGVSVLVDPMLDRAGAVGPVPNTPNQRRNPLVDLPFGEDGLASLLGGIDAVLVTHTHRDHWDERAAELIPRDVTVLCQPEDEEVISSSGFGRVVPVPSELDLAGLHLSRTGGQHGTGEVARKMAPVSGFVAHADGSPGLYIAGDTVWCAQVEEALRVHRPDVVVVNTGAAQFLEGGPITMTAEDVIRVCRALPDARVIAVHMEAINHCLLTRAGLREELQREGLSGRVEIPADGETLEIF